MARNLDCFIPASTHHVRLNHESSLLIGLYGRTGTTVCFVCPSLQEKKSSQRPRRTFGVGYFISRHRPTLSFFPIRFHQPRKFALLSNPTRAVAPYPSNDPGFSAHRLWTGNF